MILLLTGLLYYLLTTYLLLTYYLLTTDYLLTKAQLKAIWDQPSKRWYTFRALKLARSRCPQWRPYHE